MKEATDLCHYHQHTWNGNYAGWTSLMAPTPLFMVPALCIISTKTAAFCPPVTSLLGWKAIDMVLKVGGQRDHQSPSGVMYNVEKQLKLPLNHCFYVGEKNRKMIVLMTIYIKMFK